MNRVRALLVCMGAAFACVRIAAQTPGEDAAGAKVTEAPAIDLHAGKAQDVEHQPDPLIAPEDDAPQTPAPPAAQQPAPPPAAPAAPPNPSDTKPLATEPDYFKRLADEVNRPDAPPQVAASNGAPPPAPSETTSVLRALSALCVLSAVIVLGGYLARRYGRNTPLLAGQRFGTVVGRVYLSPRVSLHYVKTGGRMLIVGVTANGMYPIADLDATLFDDALADEAAAPDADVPMPGAFLSQLQSAQRRAKTEPPDSDLGSLRNEIQQLQEFLRPKHGDNP